MEAIHLAAWDGDAAAIDRLVAEDGARLNAQITVDDSGSVGRLPLRASATGALWRCCRGAFRNG